MYVPDDLQIRRVDNVWEMAKASVKSAPPLPFALRPFFESSSFSVRRFPFELCDVIGTINDSQWYPPFNAWYFELKSECKEKLENDQWTYAYHGASVETIEKILNTPGKKLEQKKNRDGVTLETNSIWVSPSSLYASHPTYAAPHSVGGHQYRYVLHLKVDKKWAQTGKGGEFGITVPVLLGRQWRLDPRIFNDQIAWWNKALLQNTVVGLVVYEGNGSPLDNGLNKKYPNRRIEGPNMFFPHTGKRIVYVIGTGTTTRDSVKGVKVYQNYNAVVMDSITLDEMLEMDVSLIIASSDGAKRIPSYIPCNLLLLSPTSIPSQIEGNFKIIFAKLDRICDHTKEICAQKKIPFTEMPNNSHTLQGYSDSPQFLEDIEMLCKETPNQDPVQLKDTVKKLVLDTHKSLTSKAAKVQERLQKLKEDEKFAEVLKDTHVSAPTYCYTVVVGRTGHGKSSLLDELLGEDFLPKGSAQEETSFVTEVRYAEEYSITVNWRSPEDWKSLCESHAIPKAEESTVVCWDKEFRGVLQCLNKGKKKKNSASSFEELFRELPPIPNTLFKAYPPSEAKEKISLSIQNVKSKWPLVKNVTITGPWEILKGGNVLVDAPGLGDTDSIRGFLVREYIEKAKAVWLVAEVNRWEANARESFELLSRETFLGLVLNEKTKLCGIVTKVDGLYSQGYDSEFIRKRMNLIRESVASSLASYMESFVAPNDKLTSSWATLIIPMFATAVGDKKALIPEGGINDIEALKETLILNIGFNLISDEFAATIENTCKRVTQNESDEAVCYKQIKEWEKYAKVLKNYQPIIRVTQNVALAKQLDRLNDGKMNLFDKWVRYPWQSFKAFCEKYGDHYYATNWNYQLCESAIPRLPLILTWLISLSELERKIFKYFDEQISEWDKSSLKELDSTVVGSLRDSIREHLKNSLRSLFKNFRIDWYKVGSDLSQHVRRKMTPAYEAASGESGRGSHGRRIDHIERHLVETDLFGGWTGQNYVREMQNEIKALLSQVVDSLTLHVSQLFSPALILPEKYRKKANKQLVALTELRETQNHLTSLLENYQELLKTQYEHNFKSLKSVDVEVTEESDEESVTESEDLLA